MKGIVYKSTGSWYTVKTEQGVFYECRLKGKFRIRGIKTTNPVSVGDKVFFEIDNLGDHEFGVIYEIENRDNYIIRKSVNLSKQTQIIAANIDLAFLIVTLNNPPTSTAFIDRFLVTSEAYGIKTILLFNKIDSYNQEELVTVKYLAHLYRSIGYECIGISAKTGKNLDKVKVLMENKVSVFSGHSGVGKSSLINYLFPHLDLTTQEVSGWSGKGMHTTTFAQMYDYHGGGAVIDTPGMRELGLVNLEKEELAQYFPEMRAKMQDCQFNNCQHINEPGCAVKAAVEKGLISEARFFSYVDLWHGIEEKKY